MKKVLVLAAALAVALSVAAAARSITWGQRDGNGHPNVGAMVAELTPGVKYEICSGTLVAPRVYLTAAHCTDYLLTNGITDVWVTFNTNSALGPYYHGTMHQAADYPGPASDPHDIAVIVLDKAVKIAPAKLPAVGLFDRMKADGSLASQRFTAVGYGDRERTHSQGSGTPEFQFDGYRWVATSGFNSLNKFWLRLSQNASTGNGGTCYGDSGGPDFLGDSNMIAGTTITGDTACVSTNTDYRMDTQEAQDFLRAWGWTP